MQEADSGGGWIGLWLSGCGWIKVPPAKPLLPVNASWRLGGVARDTSCSPTLQAEASISRNHSLDPREMPRECVNTTKGFSSTKYLH